MAEIEPTDPSGGVRVAHDVDRAAVGEEVVPLGPVGKLIDALHVDQEQPSRELGGYDGAIQKHFLVAMVRAHANDVAFVADYVDQLELPEK